MRDEPPCGTLKNGAEKLGGRASLPLSGRVPYWTRKCGTGRLHEPPYGTLIIAGRASIRDSYNYGRRRDLRDEPRYGTEALTGRVSSRTRNYGTGALAGRASLRDSSLRGGGITGRASLGDGSASGTSFIIQDSQLRDGSAYGTSLLTGLL